ncbi:hypothetical protein DV738_g5143, partial [Chaetothyriales sp. CBS 135597]
MASSLPSPPVSTPVSTPVSSASPPLNGDIVSTVLPPARRSPLRPGSQKEISLLFYLDNQTRRIQRRYGKKFPEFEEADDDAPGYTSIDQVVEDIDPLLDLAWISGTPSIQVQYLLALAGTLVSYMPAFPFSPTVFRILTKFDEAFVTLAQTPPPNIGGRAPVSMTDKVRIKSLAANARVTVVNCVTASSSSTTATQDDWSDEEDETSDGEASGPGTTECGDDVDSNIGRVFEKTVEALGDGLPSSA